MVLNPILVTGGSGQLATALMDRGAGRDLCLIGRPELDFDRLDAIPGLRLHADHGELAFGTVDTWLAWKLSGGRHHVTDPSNAARTLLYDIHRQEWCQELLDAFRVPRSTVSNCSSN